MLLTILHACFLGVRYASSLKVDFGIKNFACAYKLCRKSWAEENLRICTKNIIRNEIIEPQMSLSFFLHNFSSSKNSDNKSANKNCSTPRHQQELRSRWNNSFHFVHTNPRWNPEIIEHIISLLCFCDSVSLNCSSFGNNTFFNVGFVFFLR